MKQINNKGYMLVEIVIASVLAVSICYYLLNLTYKFKNNNEDLFQSYLYTKDKVLVTKNIMQDLDKGEVMNLDKINTSEYKEFTFNLRHHGTNNVEKRRLAITKEKNKTTIEYGKVVSISGKELEDDSIFVFDYKDISYYKKEIEPTFIIGDLEYIEDKDSETITFKIPIKSIYNDSDYSIKLYADYFDPNLMKELFTSNKSNNEYYKKDLYRENITEAYFVDYIDTTKAVSNDAIWDVSESEDGTIMAWLERNDTNKYSLYIGSKRTIYAESLNALYSNLLGLKKAEFSNLDTSLTINMDSMFASTNTNDDIDMNLEYLDLSSFDTSNVNNMMRMFYGCANLKSLNLSGWETKNLTNMAGMFYNCRSLENINNYLTKFDTSQVEDMRFLFRDCDGMTEIDLSNFNTSKVITMQYIFGECSNLETIILGTQENPINTESLVLIPGMFGNCAKLKTITINGTENYFNFNTNKITDMELMFVGCKQLEKIKFGDNFDTKNVKDMRGMFQGCELLGELNLEYFDTSNVKYMNGMFAYCKSLKNLTLGTNFNTSNVLGVGKFYQSDMNDIGNGTINGMFEGCEKINVTITIRCINDISLNGTGEGDMKVFRNMFLGAATADDAKIIVNYTKKTSTLVDNMIATKSSNSNVVKGSQVS